MKQNFDMGNVLLPDEKALFHGINTLEDSAEKETILTKNRMVYATRNEDGDVTVDAWMLRHITSYRAYHRDGSFGIRYTLTNSLEGTVRFASGDEFRRFYQVFAEALNQL